MPCNLLDRERLAMKKTDWPIRWDLLLRYRLIEIIALWEGRLTTNHICHSFGIGRQQASKDINTYLRYLLSLQNNNLQARFISDKQYLSAQIVYCGETLDTAW